jgi:hypothetical protein
MHVIPLLSFIVVSLVTQCEVTQRFDVVTATIAFACWNGKWAPILNQSSCNVDDSDPSACQLMSYIVQPCTNSPNQDGIGSHCRLWLRDWETSW